MQLSKIFKGVVIALPVMTLVACGSSQQANDQMEETNQAAPVEQTETVQSGDAVKQLSFEEEQAQKKAELTRENTIRFDFDKAGIRSEWVDLLNKHAEYLVANPSANVTVEGHCDERGTPEYNIALGERRANAVSQFLTNYGVSSSQISTVSYGEEKPEDTSRSEAGMAQNRRAILVYSY